MQWLPFKLTEQVKLTEQEKQALKEAGKDKSFKSFQIKAIFFAILILGETILLWRHYELLGLLIVVEASVFSAMYRGVLKGLRVPPSLREKIDTEIERQETEQKNALKLRPKVLLFVVLPLILILAGVVIYILYLPIHKERKEMIFGFNWSPELYERARQPIDETADWKTYKNEEYGFEVKHPSDWRLSQRDDYVGLSLPSAVEYMGKDITEYPIGANIGVSFSGSVDRRYQTMEEFFQEWNYSNPDIAANWNVSNVQQVVVNGITFYRYNWMHQDMGETYLILHDGNVISIRFSMSNLDLAQAYSDVAGLESTEQYIMFRKFLGTFRFLE